MSANGSYCAKLIDKEKRRVQRRNGNTFKPLMNRSASTYAEKAEALRVFKMQLHGFEVVKRVNGEVVGRIINEGGIRQGAIVEGSGVPHEGYGREFGVSPSEVTIEPKQTIVSRKSRAKALQAYVAAQPAPTSKVWSRRTGFC